MMELTFGEALESAQSPQEAIALALVFLDRIATALETMAEPSTEEARE